MMHLLRFCLGENGRPKEFGVSLSGLGDGKSRRHAMGYAVCLVMQAPDP